MPLAARQKHTNAIAVRNSAVRLAEHAGRAGRRDHEHVLDPLLRPARAGCTAASAARAAGSGGSCAREGSRPPTARSDLERFVLDDLDEVLERGAALAHAQGRKMPTRIAETTRAGQEAELVPQEEVLVRRDRDRDDERDDAGNPGDRVRR